MKRTWPEDLVAFLDFSGNQPNPAILSRASERDWKMLLRWLDDSGMTLYFVDRIRQTGAADSVPWWALSQMEQDLAANRDRMDYLWRRFAFLNREFEGAGIRYAALKGFSHVPEFCQDATLRHQGDLDYLVDEQSLPTAQRLLEEAGYRLKPPMSEQEFVYLLPNLGEPSLARCYAPQFHAVELHLDVWDSDLNRLPMMDRMFSVNRTRMHAINGLAFPALADEDLFLLQVLHTCRHLFTYWIRMSHTYEIGYFLSRRATDSALWKRVEERVGDNFVLRELAVVVSEMVAKLFDAPLPDLIREWGEAVRPPVRVWIDHYARYCAFWDLPVYRFNPFPRSKLTLFLHQQFGGSCAEANLVRNQLFAPTRLGRIKSAVKKDPSLVLSGKWWKRQRVLSRGAFHALSGMRYTAEIPRWRWLNWKYRRSASPGSLMGTAVPGIKSA
ncbi:MAG: nucleotidyltransferase family protein [Candidatus Sulfotelmatobacter sp.]